VQVVTLERASDLHKQNVRVCFFSEQKCTQPFSFKFFSSPFVRFSFRVFFFVRKCDRVPSPGFY
jgi:hypothetical protein